MISARHRADLRHGLVAFIDEQQRVFGQILKQRGRRFTRQTPSEEARVILDPRAAPRCRNHLQIEIGALFEALMLEQFALRLQLLQPMRELKLNRLGRLLHRGAGGDIVRVCIDPHRVKRRALLTRQRIKFGNLFNLVSEEADAPCHVLIMRGEDLQIIAAHSEASAREGRIIALVLERDQLADQLALVDRLIFLDVEDHRRIGLDRADAVKA